MSAKFNWTIPQGDSDSITITLLDKTTKEPIDITGATVYFLVKDKLSTPDEDAVITKTITVHTNPTQGKTTISLLKADTNIVPGTYLYSIVIDFNPLSASSERVTIVNLANFVITAVL